MKGRAGEGSSRAGQRSIVRNLSIALTVSTMLVSVIVIFIFSLVETRKLDSNLREKAVNSLDYLEKILENPLWNMDDPTITIIGEAFAHDEDVSQVQIRGLHDNALFAMRRSGVTDDIPQERKISRGAQTIGRIYIAYSRRRSIESIAGMIGNMALISCLVILSIYLVTTFLIRVLIKRPFDAFSGMVLSFASKDYSLGEKVSDIVEFQPLEQVLRKMGGEIVSQLGELRELNKSLEENFREREALLRELYHRTKNNMQVICALIALQSDYLEDERTKSIFLEIENRIHSMSLVHEKLYESNNLSKIGMRDYVRDLADLIQKSYDIAPGRVSLAYDVEDIQLAIDTAIPCGLILNELISNAFKHAFPGGVKGRVTIGMAGSDDGTITMLVADDGVGMDRDFDFRKQGGMGFKTVISLGEGQLRGHVDLRSREGSACSVSFKQREVEGHSPTRK